MYSFGIGFCRFLIDIWEEVAAKSGLVTVFVDPDETHGNNTYNGVRARVGTVVPWI